MKTLSTALLAVLTSLVVHAADEAPAAVAPAHSCQKPEIPGRLASDTQKKLFDRRFKEYGNCIKKYIDDQQAIVKSATDAANGAINEYNGFVKQIQAANQSD
jgi:hypothetical protein